MPDQEIQADATQDDDKIEETPTAYPDDVPADHALDPSFVPPAQYDEGLEAAP